MVGVQEMGQVYNCQPCARISFACLRRLLCGRGEQSLGLTAFTFLKKDPCQTVASQRELWSHFEDLAEQRFRPFAIPPTRINFRQIFAHPQAVPSRGDRSLVKGFRYGPVTTAHGATNAEGNRCQAGNGGE